MNENEPDLRATMLELMGELVNETITPEQYGQLEELLSDNARAREIYFDYLDNEFDLREWHEDVAVPEALLVLQQHMEQADIRQRARSTRVRSFLGYAGVAGMAVGASLVIQVLFFWGPDKIAVSPSSSETFAPKIESTQEIEYVATIARTPDCVWGGDVMPRDGWRLTPSVLNLKKGIAELRFDSGVALVIEGPTTIEIESVNAATLVKGKVVVRADETSEEFALHTATSTFVDLGTEYAVSVDPSGAAEVHVFNGVVARKATGKGHAKAAGEQLTAGQAKRFARGAESEGTPVPLAKDRFVRRVPEPTPPEDPAADLLVWESFDYDLDTVPAVGRADGGVGFAGPWVKWATSPNANLEPVADHRTPNGKKPQKWIYQNLSAHVGRPLGQPLRLDVDGLYYISFLFRQKANLAPRKAGYSLHLTFRQEDPEPIEKKLRVGVGHGRGIFGLLGGRAAKVSLPLDDETVYMMVVKIVAGRDRPDQLFATVLRADQFDAEKEPGVWTLVGHPVHTNLQLPSVWIHFDVFSDHNVECHQWLDELRIGTTWASVTASLSPPLNPPQDAAAPQPVR